jgi:hypothetical protein
MSQTILPPQPEQQPPAPPPGYYYPAYNAPVVVEPAPTPPGYQPDPPKKQALIWRIIKWPIRQVLKAIYLIGRAASSHKVVSAILLVIILALVGAGVFVYRTLNPDTTASTGGQAAASGQAAPDTPFTIVNTSAPPLSNGVIHWLHAYKTYNGQEQWDSLSPSLQQSISGRGATARGLQTDMDQLHAQGVTFEQFIYTGGYFGPNGLATYTIQVVLRQGNQRGIQTWYFYVDESNDLIVSFLNLTPGANG